MCKNLGANQARSEIADVSTNRHSEYSIADSVIRLPALVKQAAAQGYPAVAVTDQGNLFGLVKFYKSALDAGLKPIFGCDLQLLSDDAATVQYRTKGGQKAPLIVRTRGHRLEGIWHSGSLMAGLIHLVRGMNVCVPRNFVQAAGMYNTLLQSDEPVGRMRGSTRIM